MAEASPPASEPPTAASISSEDSSLAATTVHGALSTSDTTFHTTTQSATSISHLTNLPTLPSETPLPSSLHSSVPSSIPASNGNYASSDGPGATSSSQHSTLVNLYFFFLLVAGVIAALAVWWFYRRKNKKAQAMQSSRRSALERDLSDTVGGSSGFFGPVDGERWRNRHRWLTNFAFSTPARGAVNNVEGLDAAGHAPPPYKVQSEETITAKDAGLIHKPPEYHEITLGSDGSSVEGGNSTTRTSTETRRERDRNRDSGASSSSG